MSDEAARRWAGITFAREMAAEEHQEFVESLGHPPIDFDRWWRTVGAENESEAKEVEVKTIRAREWSGPLPTPAKSLTKAAKSIGYDTIASFTHQERRGSHGRQLDPPEADVCTVMARRGDEAFLVAWEQVKGSWKFREALDYTPRDGVIPRICKITELKRERL